MLYDETEELEFDYGPATILVRGTYVEGTPATMYNRYGDPGDPGEPSQFEIRSISLDGTKETTITNLIDYKTLDEIEEIAINIMEDDHYENDDYYIDENEGDIRVSEFKYRNLDLIVKGKFTDDEYEYLTSICISQADGNNIIDLISIKHVDAIEKMFLEMVDQED